MKPYQTYNGGMAKRSTATDRIIIDPHFTIPDDALDAFAYTYDAEDMDEYVEGDDLSLDAVDEVTYSEIDYEESYDDQDAVYLSTPEEFTIISQVIRRAPGGQNVVDIVIDAEDINGAVNYEIRVVKV